MLIAEARVETERSSRYLRQLCQHFHHEAKTHPDVQAHVEWTDHHGVADFGWGRCTLRADSGVLALRADASEEDGLQRVELLVADHLGRFATSDQLTVTWVPQGAGERLANQAPGATDRGDAHG